MNNPKEKAIELVNRFLAVTDSTSHYPSTLMFHKEAKQCALIVIDEIIKSKPILKPLCYWQEVKQEIENL